MLRLVTGSFILAGILAACDPEEACVSSSTNVIRLGFYVTDEKGVVKAGPFTFSSVKVLRSDSAYFEPNPAGAASISLALDPAADSTTFIFKHDKNTDSLVISYNRDFRIISPECGVEIKFNRLQVAGHSFDSVQLIATELPGPAKGFDVAIYSLEPCNSPFTNLLEAGFKIMSRDGEEVNFLENFDLIRAVGVDTVLYRRNETGINQLSLPLNPAADSTAFIFVNEEKRDTLQINYKLVQRIYSPECGQQNEFTNISISGSHSFDTVRVINPNLSKTNQGFDIEIIK